MRSPRGPPNGPALPSPTTRIWAPESTPAGTVTPTGSTAPRTPRTRGPRARAADTAVLAPEVDARRNGHADRLDSPAHAATEARRAPAAFPGAGRPAFGTRRGPVHVEPRSRPPHHLGQS